MNGRPGVPSSDDYDDDFDDFDGSGDTLSARKFSIPNLDKEQDVGVFSQIFSTKSGTKIDPLPAVPVDTLKPRTVRPANNYTSIGCGTADFFVNLECQTDTPETYPSWTQAPPSSASAESDNDKKLPFSDIARLQQMPVRNAGRQTDPAGLSAFMRKAGSLILEMLSEDAYERKTFVTRKKNPAEEALVVGQESCGQHFLFTQCRVESVRVSSATTPFFLISHSFLPNVAEAKGRVQGFVSGWNSLSVTVPVFILATYDIPTVAVTLLTSGDFVVSGHRDGSLACWDRGENSVAYGSLFVGTLFGEVEGKVEHPNGMPVGLPCFHSCAAQADNHGRSVVDLVAFSDNVQTQKSMGHTACASLDESGEILIWHGVQRSADEAWKETDVAGATPGARFLIVRIRRLQAWPVALVTASRIFADPSDSSVFFVTSNDGRIRRVHRDGVSMQPNSYGTDSGADVPVSFHFSDPTYFLSGSFDGQIFLYSKKFSMPIRTWLPSTSGRLLSVVWANNDPRKFVSADEWGVVTLWSMQGNLGDPLQKTTKITSDSADGSVVVKWKGVVSGSSTSLLFWTEQLRPLVVYLNTRLQEQTPGDAALSDCALSALESSEN